MSPICFSESMRSDSARIRKPSRIASQSGARQCAHDPQVPLALGRAYIALDKFAEANDALEKATHLDAKLASAWFARGIAYLDSVELSARSMTAAPDSAFAQALYAESLEEQFRFREASDIFAKVIEMHPQPPCMRSELGYALLRQHDSPRGSFHFCSGGRRPSRVLALSFGEGPHRRRIRRRPERDWVTREPMEQGPRIPLIEHPSPDRRDPSGTAVGLRRVCWRHTRLSRYPTYRVPR